MHLAVISSVGRLCWLIWREPVWYWSDLAWWRPARSWSVNVDLMKSQRITKVVTSHPDENVNIWTDHVVFPSEWWTTHQHSHHFKHLATRWRNVRGSAERNPPLDTWTCEPTVRLHDDPPCSGGDHFTPDQHADILKRMKDVWLLIAVSMWR